MESKIILPSSDEAASIKTVTGWVSRNGHFWGEDERMARYDGSTHRECDKCKRVIEKNGYCRDCWAEGELKKYEAMERRKWNGTDALYSQVADEFFFDEDHLGYHCEDNEVYPNDLRLIICEPVYATQIDANDYYADDLPEDGELPVDLWAAFDELNTLIRESKIVLCWRPGKYAVEIGADGRPT